jgi:hypothetical protein
MLQVVASLLIVILVTLETSFTIALCLWYRPQKRLFIFCRWAPVGARPGLDGWRWQGRTSMDNRAAIAISPLPGREIRVGAMTKIRMTWRRNLIYPNKQISQLNTLLKWGAMTKVRNTMARARFFYFLTSVFHLVIYLTMKTKIRLT